SRPIEIPELLCAILDTAGARPNYVVHCIPTSMDIRTSARLLSRYALVSKFWNECATPLLWEMLPDQLPLLKLLPTDAWTTIDVSRQSSFLEQGNATQLVSSATSIGEFWVESIYQHIARELSGKDWEPVEKLGRHVKVLRFDSQLCTPSTLAMISATLPNPLPLPNLERLHVTTHGPSDNDFLPLLCSPKLWDLQIWVQCDGIPVLGHISRQCPRLTHLLLTLAEHDFDRDLAGAKVLGYNIVSMPTITHLSLLVGLDIAGLLVVVLGHCQQLTHLRLCDPSHVLMKPESALALHALESTLIWSLRSLHLPRVCPDFAMALLRSLGNEPLEMEVLKMPITCFRTRDEMKQLIEAVAQHCSPATLVHLNIIAGQPPIPVVNQLPNPAMVPIEFFRPLSHYRLLESASLGESGGAIGLTDDDYAELAQWWPNMVHLRIPNVTGTASTLKTLLAFARHCKRLETVNLKLDAYSLSLSIEEIAAAIRGGVPALKRLEINDGRIGTTDDVADCLSTLFPALMEVVYRGDDE
ncbi:hypothetical protein FB107DRAFT_183374, partial [Schizophyllum commune]